MTRLSAWAVQLLTAGAPFRGGLAPFIAAPSREILVGNHGYDPETAAGTSVTRYRGNANGNSSPTTELATYNVTALAKDADGNILVASDSDQAIHVYAPGAIGRAAPIRTISGPVNTGVQQPTGIALDAAGNIFVAEQGGTNLRSAILKFRPESDGDVAPIGRIPSMNPPSSDAPSNTQLGRASGVAVDSSGHIYVADPLGNSLLIFNPGSDGDIAPAEIISHGLHQPQQVALGPDQSVFVSNYMSTDSVVVYAARPINGGVDAALQHRLAVVIVRFGRVVILFWRVIVLLE
jgi:NHL repeat